MFMSAIYFTQRHERLTLSRHIDLTHVVTSCNVCVALFFNLCYFITFILFLDIIILYASKVLFFNLRL